VTVAQLHGAGLDDRAIARRVADGRLHRIARGVYAVGHAALSREGQFLAAVLGSGEGALLGRLAAAELRQVSRFRSSLIDVVVPKWRRKRDGVRLHRARALHPRDVTEHKGIPVTSIARTLVDLSDVLTAHQLANVIHEAAFRGLFGELPTRDAMERANGRHNLHVLEKALELNAAGSAGTKSGLEDAFLSLLQLAGIPEPLVNSQVEGIEVDLHWAKSGLCVEIDGPGHGRPRTKREDAGKQAKLEAAGYEVIRVPEHALQSGSERVAAILARSSCRR
jgi:hypothetical protein